MDCLSSNKTYWEKGYHAVNVDQQLSDSADGYSSRSSASVGRMENGWSTSAADRARL